MSYKDFFQKPEFDLDEVEEKRVNALKPDENGDLMENGDYIFQDRAIHNQQGNTIQRSFTTVKGVRVMEDTYIPWSCFQPMRMTFVVDLTLPDDTLPTTETSWMQNWYEPEGFAHPAFVNFEDVVEFIIKWRKSNPKVVNN